MTRSFERVVVLGGSGFIGSHLCDQLLAEGSAVICVDNLLTGSVDNVSHLMADQNFSFVRHDITEHLEISGPVDAVLNFASPASPVDYLQLPIETMTVGSQGTHNALELAKQKGARLLLASTSEVYGDPHVHPQKETYWGNVNPNGPRSVYDEAKRYAEALTMAYYRTYGVDVGIVRIFNTYGPRMRPSDGRVVSNFIVQALQGEPLTIYGNGSQTRSFCFVDDEVRGILALLHSALVGPVNIGNPNDFTILQLAKLVIELTASRSDIEHRPLPVDDPTQRCPDISVAKRELGWEPAVELRQGLAVTAAWFASLYEGSGATWATVRDAS